MSETKDREFEIFKEASNGFCWHYGRDEKFKEIADKQGYIELIKEEIEIPNVYGDESGTRDIIVLDGAERMETIMSEEEFDRLEPWSLEDFYNGKVSEEFFDRLSISADMCMYEPEDAFLLGNDIVVNEDDDGNLEELSIYSYLENSDNKYKCVFSDKVLVRRGDTKTWKKSNRVSERLVKLLVEIQKIVILGGSLCRVHMRGDSLYLSNYDEYVSNDYDKAIAKVGMPVEGFGEYFKGKEYKVVDNNRLLILFMDLLDEIGKFGKPVKELYWLSWGSYSKIRARKCEDGEYILVVS